MSVDYRVFYGYGYEISNEQALNLSPEKYDELMDSDYTQILDGYNNDEHRCFFGIILDIVPACSMCKVPVVDDIDHNDFKNMINEYQNIFNEFPGMVHFYVGFAVT